MKPTHPVPWISLAFVAAVPFFHPLPAAAVDTSAFVAPDDGALLVFVQTERIQDSSDFIVFDTKGICLATLGPRQAEVLRMKPGRYTLFVSDVANQNSFRLELALAAGRTYFVRLYSVNKYGWTAPQLATVQRGSNAYKGLKTWLDEADVTYAHDDPCRGKPADRRSNRTQRRINEANADWKHEGDEYRRGLILIESDGLTATEVSWL